MSIPNNITKQNLIDAAEKIVKEGIPNNGNSSTYDVLFNGQLLPPKLVVAYANIFANGIELDRNSFQGGIGTDCFNILEKEGFEIVRKNGYYSELSKFFDQTTTLSQKTLHYQKEFLGLTVQVSFGQGNPAKIPWISFLGKNQKTANGIYPVYLYYKEHKLLILAYGVSETNKPILQWDLNEDVPTIREYFIDRDLGRPDRYGASFVFKAYNVESMPSPILLDNDLYNIVQEYKAVLNEIPFEIYKEVPKTVFLEVSFDVESFIDAVYVTDLKFEDTLLERFISSIVTKPFVILSGLSGSGKTKLAQAFVEWICEDEDQYKLVPVGADWTNRDPLLGYPNALEEEKYIKPDNGVVDLILHASEHTNLPHFLILDEMNLSHVERYFADFLSVMESNGRINFHSGIDDKSGVPSSVAMPDNLFIIGTINVDETTYMFSPKVLDRANVIEFRITEKEIGDFLANPLKPDLKKLKAAGAGMSESFMELARTTEFENPANSDLNTTLVKFFGELKKLGAEFGYRSAYEIHRLINQLSVIDSKMAPEKKLDIAIMQKLLPKLHGSRRKLCPVLGTLGGFCVDETKIENIEKFVFDVDEFDFESEGVLYPLSLEKITRMYKGAVDNGFASYAEA